MTVAVQSVPRAPGAVPLIGHTLKLWRDPLRFLASLRGSGELVRVDLGTMPVYVATSARMVNEVTVRQARSFEKGRLFDRVRPLVGNGLANSGGETHRAHRRLMQPMFHQQRLGGYAEIMSNRAQALADSWTPGQRIVLDEVLGAYAIETLAETMFSADLGRSAVEAVRRNFPVILKNMLIRAASPKFLDRLPIRPNREFDAATARMLPVIDEVIAGTRRSGRTDRPDLLSVLLAARDADTGQSLTDIEVRDQIMTILFAGTETTASTLSWAFHELARHPEVERQLVAEIDRVVGSRPVTMEDVPRLTAIRRVLDEVIRLYGVTLLMRRATADVELGGFTVPAGSEVAFSLYALHRDPGLFEDPDRFDPDRWLPERRAALGREEFVPFGSGNRKCIGDAFAWTEATIVLATVLRRWKLRPQAGQPAPRAAASAMAHPDRVPMTVLPRDA
ncbi:cytochrome P450 [Streptomyces sp. NRRL S-118]|uniref:cytochrome P450 n=1 Tax=Streptomyces sp. NRRL S-118 TaxID=1463881 RepID=UPI000B269325|nr:cytochrome P450 [Streptomyces sp. NRRL S-118]